MPTIADHHGSPALVDGDGQPGFPMLFWQSRPLRPDVEAFAGAGVDLLTFFRSGPHYERPYWREDGSIDCTAIDAGIAEALQANPRARCLPRIFVSAPHWWVERHPEEGICHGHPGWTWRGCNRESFASQRWLAEMGEAFRQVVRHILAAPYADRVMGIHVAGGTLGEWHAWTGDDSSTAMQERFRAHLRRRYGDDEGRLRSAWNDPAAAFATASVPSRAEKDAGVFGAFYDPAHSRRVIDYYDCHHAATAEAIGHFCRIVKEEGAGRLLTCVFFGYTPDYNQGGTMESSHLAAAQVFAMDCVDIISSPHSYSRRQPGDDGYFRNFLGSVALHGKLFIDEGDDQTYCNHEPWYSPDRKDCIHLLRREFANAASHNAGLWYMDLAAGWDRDTAFFHDRVLMREIAALKRWGDRAMALPRTRGARVAVISSLRSHYHVGPRRPEGNRVGYALHRDQIRELCRCGATFDWFLAEDLGHAALEGYQVIILLDCFHLAEAEIAALGRLKSRGRTLLWFYAPGFAGDHDLSVQRMAGLTGFDFAVEREGGILDARLAGGREEDDFGTHQPQAPRFVPACTPGEAVAWYPDTGLPAMAERRFADWRSIYCGAPGLPAGELRRICREAGVHVYSEDGDNLTASDAWLAVHTVDRGTKRFALPRPARVTEIATGRVVGTAVTTFTVDLPSRHTAIFLLEPPDASQQRSTGNAD